MSTKRGRAQVATVGPWIAGVVAIVIVLFPYLIWLDLDSSRHQLPRTCGTIAGNLAPRWGWLVVVIAVSHAGMAILLGRWSRGGGARDAGAPVIVRSPRGRRRAAFVYFFAFTPVLGDGPVRAVHAGGPENFGVAPLVVMSGLAVDRSRPASGSRSSHQY